MSNKQGRRGGGPFMLPVESGLIGAALTDPAAVIGHMAQAGVRAEWFSSEAGQLIGGMLLERFAEGKPVDLIIMSQWLHDEGRPELLAEIEEAYSAGIAGHGPAYTGELLSGWFKRGCNEDARELIEGLRENKTSAEVLTADAIGRLVGRIDVLRRGRERSAADIRRDVVEGWIAARGGGGMGLPWPSGGMNALTCGMYPGITTVAARPSVGKSTMEGWVARHLLMRGKRVARACLDMRAEDLLARDLCAVAGESFNKMRGGYMTDSDGGKFDLCLEVMKSWQECVISERTSDGIVARARALRANGGLDLLTVDYVQLLDTGVDNRANDNVRISRAVARLKEFSVESGVPVLLLSQLSREVEKENRRPQLSDLRDSGSIEQESAVVIFLYIDPVVGKAFMELEGVNDMKKLDMRPVIWDVLKNQNGMLGSVGLRMMGRYYRVEQASAACEEDYTGTDFYSHGYDFRSTQGPYEDDEDSGVYVVCKHELGAVELFDYDWFRRLNEAARRIGVSGYEEIKRVSGGVADGIFEMNETRANMRR